MLILNIGLRRNDGTEINEQAVRAALIGRVRAVVYCGTFASDTEPTAVYVVAELNTTQAYRLAETLWQDCIAIYDVRTERGRLVGPKADAWGDFDPARFIGPRGGKL